MTMMGESKTTVPRNCVKCGKNFAYIADLSKPNVCAVCVKPFNESDFNKFKSVMIKYIWIDTAISTKHPKCKGYYDAYAGEYDCSYKTSLDCDDCKYGLGKKDPEAKCYEVPMMNESEIEAKVIKCNKYICKTTKLNSPDLYAMMKPTELHERVKKRAIRDNLPIDHPMIVAAEKFTEAANGYFAEPQTVNINQFMGCFARARKAWCEYTGEPLV